MAVAAPTALSYTFAAPSSSTARAIDAASNLLAVFLCSMFTPTSYAVTYGGNTLLDFTGGLQGITSSVYGQGFYLPSPPTGSNTLAVTLGTSRITGVTVFGLSGADTTTPFRTQTGSITYQRAALNPGTNPSVTLAGSVGDLAIDSIVFNATTDTTMTATGSNTEAVTQIRDNTGTDWIKFGASTAPGGASVSMAWTLGSKSVQQLGAMVAAAASAGGPPTRRAMTGFGI